MGVGVMLNVDVIDIVWVDDVVIVVSIVVSVDVMLTVDVMDADWVDVEVAAFFMHVRSGDAATAVTSPPDPVIKLQPTGPEEIPTPKIAQSP